MDPTPEQVGVIEAWLRATFPGTHVASDGDFDREVQLFRARTNDNPSQAYELEISYLAFEDHPNAGEILAVLEKRRAADQMRADPHYRFFLDRDLVLGVV